MMVGTKRNSFLLMNLQNEKLSTSNCVVIGKIRKTKIYKSFILVEKTV